jgi:hypothetical protein
MVLGGCTGQQNNVFESPSPVQFTVDDQLPDARVGEPYSYSFCKPDCLDENDLCGSEATPSINPTGGNAPYHFPTGFRQRVSPTLSYLVSERAAQRNTHRCRRMNLYGLRWWNLGGHQCCVQVSLNVLEPRINVSPNDVLVKGEICFDGPCEVPTTVTVSSPVLWHILFFTGSGTNRCYDTVEEFFRYRSVCPSEGGAGETLVTLSTMMYGEATPDYYEEPLIDRGSTIRFEAVDDGTNYAELQIALERPIY